MSHDKEEKLMVIDTDCGIDDAMAILLALRFQPTWKILAITCCNGNTTVDNACNNVLKVLHLCGQSNIPVYRGCNKPLRPLETIRIGVHGDDGLGNVANEYSSGDLTVSKEHAVNALIQLAKDYKGMIHLVALAPLTNIAMAHRLDPEFTANLKSLTFMGGNVQGVGNYTSAAEFNFYVDPEAAHIICNEVLCPTTMVPWETTLKHPMPWDMYEDIIRQGKTINAQFVSKISSDLAVLQKARIQQGFVMPDFLAVSALVEPSSVVETMNYFLTVETTGRYTRGQTCVLWRSSTTGDERIPTIKAVIGMNREILIPLYNKLLA